MAAPSARISNSCFAPATSRSARVSNSCSTPTTSRPGVDLAPTPGDGARAPPPCPAGHNAPCGGDHLYMLLFRAAQMVLPFISNFHSMAWLSVVAAVMSFTYATIGLGLGLAKTIAVISDVKCDNPKEEGKVQQTKRCEM
ncbi:putative amino acid permease 7 [Zea mays]|uniref:Putative amino acid permease 7 n=1 Tax=Zea mays TaxID=4577 RepID=A0A3L6EGP2_MAIZE|nr:putative amino acid permease 7 [Zea mays]